MSLITLSKQEKQAYNSKQIQYKRKNKNRIKRNKVFVSQYVAIPNITIVITLPL